MKYDFAEEVKQFTRGYTVSYGWVMRTTSRGDISCRNVEISQRRRKTGIVGSLHLIPSARHTSPYLST